MSIQSLDRAISILNLFKDSRGPIGITEIAKKLGLVKTTAYGLVTTLEKNGFLQKDPYSRKYRLGFALFELSSIQMDHLQINQCAQAPLQKLSNKLSRLCRVAIWDRNSIIVTMVTQPHGHDSTSRQFGPRLPAYCTALGKAILSNMPKSELDKYLDDTELISYTPNTITDRKILENKLMQIREKGYSISNMEALPNRSGIGAVIRESENKIAGSISVRLEENDQESKFLELAANVLTQTAAEISMEMGYKINYRF